jgi:uncharacterized protein YgbK (DUF1537 family)
MRLGCIADDLTGAADLANNLARGGMRVSLRIGLQEGAADDVDATVISLKSRTAPVAEAVSDALAAARWLTSQGATQIYFKICSTFDSTSTGNIGPVAEALAGYLSARSVAVTPAFPAGGRSVYLGHLFVGSALLSDSSMRTHPLTPMTDANLLRVLQAASRCSVWPGCGSAARVRFSGGQRRGFAASSGGSRDCFWQLLGSDTAAGRRLHQQGRPGARD